VQSTAHGAIELGDGIARPKKKHSYYMHVIGFGWRVAAAKRHANSARRQPTALGEMTCLGRRHMTAAHGR